MDERGGSAPEPPLLPQLGSDRVRALLEAVLAVGTGLSLPDVLGSIVEGACRLAGARYGALGVVGSDEQLSQFLTVGIDEETRRRIGDEPRGHGILGLLVRDPKPLMLRDLSAHPSSVGFPPNHPPMRSFLGVPVRARDAVFGNLYLCEKQGADEFTATDQELVSTLAIAAGVAIENASLFAEERRREEWLAAIAEINHDLLGGAGVDSVLHGIAASAGAIARADAVRVMVCDDDRRTMTIVATHGTNAETTVGMKVPVEGTAAGDACITGETQVVDDATQDPRVFLPAIGALQPGSVVYAPVSGADGVFAVLSVDIAKGGRSFEALDIDVIGSFARQAGLAIELARSRGNQDRVRMLEDRERIGRNLHDTVIQRLFAVGMLLQATIKNRSGADSDRISRAIDEIDTTIKEIRTSIFTLAHQRDTGVRAEILELVQGYADVAGFEPHVLFDGPVDTAIPVEVASHLFAVVREAVSNASRHASAKRVEVSLVVTDQIVLQISDDGVGLPEKRVRRSGIANMEARAVELGGSLEVASVDGCGTTVTWRVPLSVAPRTRDG